MRNVLISASSFALLAGCDRTREVAAPDIMPRFRTLPTIQKSALHAGMYSNPEFAGAQQLHHLGPDTYVISTGDASVRQFDRVIRAAFGSTTRIYPVAPERLAD